MANLRSTRRELMKKSVNLYKERVKKVIPLSILTILFITVLRYDLLDFMPEVEINSLFVLSTIFFMAISGFVTTFFGCMMFYIIANNVGIKESFNFCASVVEQILLGFILTYLTIVVGLCFFVIPGIYLSVSLFFVIPLIILDAKPALEAFKSSYKMVQGRWFYTASSYFYMVFPIFIVILIIKIIGFLFLPEIITEILFITIKVFVTPYTMIALYIIFKEIKSQ